MKTRNTLLTIGIVAAVILCAAAIAVLTRGDRAQLAEAASVGPSPNLPPPTRTLIPTVEIAPAKGWSGNAKPAAASGLEVVAFATGLEHPRWLYVLPNGDVLVAETNAPSDRPEDGKGIKGFAYRTVQRWAGAGEPSANRITLLRRENEHDGVSKTIFLDNLNSPYGMVLVGNDLYVATTDAVMRFPYKEGATNIMDPGVKLTDLPAGPINHHWTKNIIASRDGAHLYATVGSNSNAGENGLDKEENRPQFWRLIA